MQSGAAAGWRCFPGCFELGQVALRTPESRARSLRDIPAVPRLAHPFAQGGKVISLTVLCINSILRRFIMLVVSTFSNAI